ncbi:MAG TPA: hypothetical protein VK551_10935 [Thermodesulfobacteriota bacterium]|nr:hypothetical protein [Thermodesulfobacteriota bacterium]
MDRSNRDGFVKMLRAAHWEMKKERKEVRGLLIESKAIGNDEVDIYLSSKYRVTTIIPFKGNPVMNVYLFTKEELNDFLEGYDQYAEFLVSVEQAEAIA